MYRCCGRCAHKMHHKPLSPPLGLDGERTERETTDVSWQVKMKHRSLLSTCGRESYHRRDQPWKSHRRRHDLHMNSG